MLHAFASLYVFSATCWITWSCITISNEPKVAASSSLPSTGEPGPCWHPAWVGSAGVGSARWCGCTGPGASGRSPCCPRHNPTWPHWLRSGLWGGHPGWGFWNLYTCCKLVCSCHSFCKRTAGLSSRSVPGEWNHFYHCATVIFLQYFDPWL